MAPPVLAIVGSALAATSLWTLVSAARADEQPQSEIHCQPFGERVMPNYLNPIFAIKYSVGGASQCLEGSQSIEPQQNKNC